MGSWVVKCRSCHDEWTIFGCWSDYERQAVESRPCPECGAYTLASPEPKPLPARRGDGRRVAIKLGRQVA